MAMDCPVPNRDSKFDPKTVYHANVSDSRHPILVSDRSYWHGGNVPSLDQPPLRVAKTYFFTECGTDSLGSPFSFPPMESLERMGFWLGK